MLHAHQVLLNRGLQDLNPILAGHSESPAGEHIIPDARLGTLIHYVTEGRGTLHLNSKNYSVHAGQAFIILPGQVASYTADKRDPWKYRWVGFTGALAEQFAILPPVFEVTDDMFTYLRVIDEGNQSLPYQLAADLFVLYSKLLYSDSKRPNYVQMVTEYIQAYYMRPLTVQEIADHVGLNRYYLSKHFKKRTGRSIQEQILDVRLSEARRYLLLGYSVKETAALCGYSAASIFSKLFKKEYDMSPTEWRQNYFETVGKIWV